LAKVPTLVSEDETTLLANVVPVSVPAAATAVTVQVLPRVQVCPFTVVALLARLALAIAVPFHTPVVIVPTLVKEDVTTFEASVVPVNVPAGAITALVLAAVISPLALTVNDGIAVEEPKLPTFEFTVARVVAAVPLVVTSPVKFPLVIDVAPLKKARLPETGLPVSVMVPELVPHALVVVVNKPPVVTCTQLPTVRPVIVMALEVAAPRFGVVNVGEITRATFPVPLVANHTGAAPTVPVPVCANTSKVVVVFGARNAVVLAALWYGSDPSTPPERLETGDDELAELCPVMGLNRYTAGAAALNADEMLPAPEIVTPTLKHT
jgi:hypothetical protein